ncbi:MAG TPA: hypothetical protein VJ350_05215 [Methanoregula sp.]|nr:hypothetical protein [Methanoregula sp.]
MQSLPSLAIEPEPALQYVIWRKSGVHEGQDKAHNNWCGIMNTLSPHINTTCVTTRRHAAYKRSCRFK